VQHKTKDLINASVLGKIFEKLNGYKDGSFYTPSYITMYMSQKVVRNAIRTKFNEKFAINAVNFAEVKQFTTSKYKIEDKQSFNQAINEITVCDPAVGSGHFLVSVLNELICAKSELEILYDNDNQPLQYWIAVENDELKIYNKHITNQEFEYKAEFKNGIRTINPELQKVQTTLFREKQGFIENSLYGVDVNPNSVQICRLRLWIELLKNSYYTADSNFSELETLPNLEYKVMEGNSLLSVYQNQPVMIDWKRKYADNIKSISRNITIINQSIETIKTCKQDYFKAGQHIQKQGLSAKINRAKADLLTAKFEIEIEQINENLRALDPEQRLDKQLNRQDEKQRQELLEKKTFLQKVKREIDYSPDLGKPIILFDWNIDFAEIIGTFQNGNGNSNNYGFDIVIGNPPYIQNKKLAYISDYLREIYSTFNGIADISVCFFEKGINILKEKGQLCYINSNKFFISEYGKPLRSFLTNYNNTEFINLEQVPVFDEALVSTSIFHIEKRFQNNSLNYIEFYRELVTPEIFNKEIAIRATSYNKDYLKNDVWIFNKPEEDIIIDKIKLKGQTIDSIPTIKIRMGIKTGFDDAFIIDKPIYEKLSKREQNLKILVPVLRGKDIQKYFVNYHNYWLINSHNGQQGKYQTIDIVSDFPDIYNYFIDIDKNTDCSVSNRSDQGKHWTNLRSCAFLDDFNKEKIIWGLISGIWGFSYDNKNYFVTSASAFLVSEQIPIKFLLALLNSRLYQFYFDKTGEYTAGGAYVLKKINIEKFIIPTQKMDYEPYIEIVDKILAAKEQKQDTIQMENELNNMIYKLYDINEIEQQEIETILIKRKIK
jgi:hypothetical protein